MSVKINYNGNIIASLENGQTGTLECKSKLMLDDITVNVTMPEYDGEVEGGSAVKLISFTVDGYQTYTFQAEEGMTWREFIASKYNPADEDWEVGKQFFLASQYPEWEDLGMYEDMVYYEDPWHWVTTDDGVDVLPDDVIINGHEYMVCT